MLYRSGAQGSTAHNKAYVALGLLLGDGDEATAEMIQAVRERIAIIRFFQPQATKIVGHSDLKPTSCPGNHVRALLRAGAFEPDATDSPTPPAAQRTLQERVEAIEAEIESLKSRIG